MVNKQDGYKIVTVATLSTLTTIGWSPALLVGLIIVLSVILTIGLVQNIRERREKHRIFEKGNLPSMGNVSILSGNAFDLMTRGNFCRILLETHKRLGRNFGVFYGPDPWLISTDLDLIHRVYVSESHKHLEWPNFRLPHVPLVVGSFLQIKKDPWLKSRQAINPHLSTKRIKSDLETQAREESCEKLLNYIASQPVKEGARLVDVFNSFGAYIFDVTCRLALGREDVVSWDPKKKNELADGAESAIGWLVKPVVLMGILMDWLRTPMTFFIRFTDLNRFNKHLDSIFEESMSLRMKSKSNQGTGDAVEGSSKSVNPNPNSEEDRMIDSIIRCAQDSRTKNVNVNALLYFIVMAGFKNPTAALAIMFWYLAKNRHIQEKLRQAILIEGEEAPYLEWCIRETLRLFPSVPSTARVLTEDVVTERGERIFKGTPVVANIYSIHHSEEYWGSDAEEFRPERFGEPFKHPHQFLAFGAGSRLCPGRHLAGHEMRAIAARILSRYQVEPSHSTPKQLSWNANLVHLAIDGPIDLNFLELKSS